MAPLFLIDKSLLTLFSTLFLGEGFLSLPLKLLLFDARAHFYNLVLGLLLDALSPGFTRRHFG